jgi:hypothetical protein
MHLRSTFPGIKDFLVVAYALPKCRTGAWQGIAIFCVLITPLIIHLSTGWADYDIFLITLYDIIFR